MAASPTTDVTLSTSKVNLTYHDCLPANTEESKRLKLQHQIIQRALGNVIVHVPVSLDVPGTAVLEACTGSAIWLLDLAKTVPTTTELVGIDIQSNLFPVASSIPQNISLEVRSVLDLPLEWNNKFALVHQRLIFVAFTRADWSKALDNIYRTLQPGGWIQLLEIDEWPRAGPLLESYSLLWKNIQESRGIHGSWPNGSRMWKVLVEEAGFVEIEVKWCEMPVGKWAGRDGIDVKENLKGLMKAIRTATVENGGFGVISGAEEGYDNWMRDVEAEVDQGVNEPAAKWVMICARKPS